VIPVRHAPEDEGERAMSDWRALEDWKRGGPGKDIDVLLLLSDGKIVIGYDDSSGQRWRHQNPFGKDDGWYRIVPVAWMPLPEVPTELKDRLKFLAEEEERVERERRDLDELAGKPLGGLRR
jgi:hypothetical protein